MGMAVGPAVDILWTVGWLNEVRNLMLALEKAWVLWEISVTEVPVSNILRLPPALIVRSRCVYSINSFKLEVLRWVPLVLTASFLPSSWKQNPWGYQSRCFPIYTMTLSLGPSLNRQARARLVGRPPWKKKSLQNRKVRNVLRIQARCLKLGG